MEVAVLWDGGLAPFKSFPSGRVSLQKSRAWLKKYVVILRQDGVDSLAWFPDEDAYRLSREAHFTLVQAEGRQQLGPRQPLDEVRVEEAKSMFFHFDFDGTCLVIRPEVRVDELAQFLENRGMGDSVATAASTSPPLPEALPRYTEVPDHIVARQFRLKAALSELRQIVPESVAKLDLPPSFNSICLAGAQSVGKSTLLEYIVGCPCAFRRGGVGTRRPIIYHVMRNDTMPSVEYRFADQKTPVNYDELVAELAVRQGTVFKPEAVEVHIEGPQLFTITVVDLPGYVVTEDLKAVKNINRVHISRPDSLVVLVRRAVDWEAGDDSEAKRAVQDVDPNFERTIVVTNQTRFQFNSLKQQMPRYLHATGDGTVFYPRAKKFFVDVMLAHTQHETAPVDIPTDPVKAHECIMQATADLEEALASVGVDLDPDGPFGRYIGVRRLGQYLRYAVIGDERIAAGWAKASEDKLLEHVERELRLARRHAIPASRMRPTLNYSVQLFAKTLVSLLESPDDESRTGGLTSAEEHFETLAVMPACIQEFLPDSSDWELDPDSWPQNAAPFDGKEEKEFGAQSYQRFQDYEIPAVLAKASTGQKSLLFKSDDEVNEFSGIVVGVSRQTLEEQLRKAVATKCSGLFVNSTRYAIQRAIFCLTLQQFDEVVARIPAQGEGQSLSDDFDVTPQDLLSIGLLREGSLWREYVHKWLRQYVATKVYPDAVMAGKYLSNHRLVELGNAVDTAVNAIGPKPMKAANAIIESRTKEFEVDISTLIGSQVKNTVLETIEINLGRKVDTISDEDVALVFEDGNSNAVRKYYQLEKIKELLSDY